MTWTLENEQYHVELPEKYMFRDFLDIFESDEMLAFDFRGKSSCICAVQADRPNQKYVVTGEILSHKQGEEDSKFAVTSQRKFQIHPMLIPLDKEGVPCSSDLAKELPNGTILDIGYLAYNGEEMFPSYNSLDSQFDLREEGTGAPLSWIVCNGCLISRQGLFFDTAEAAWKMFYTALT